MPDYPEYWEPQEETSSTEICPALAGLYDEMGEAPYDCFETMEPCRSLSYNLLSGNIGYKEVWDESSDITLVGINVYSMEDIANKIYRRGVNLSDNDTNSIH